MITLETYLNRSLSNTLLRKSLVYIEHRLLPTMNRLGLLDPDELLPAQKDSYDMMRHYLTERYSGK